MPSINNNRASRRAIPHVPVLSLATFAGFGPTLPSLLDDTDGCLVTSGRIAIGLALQALGVAPGDTVLVPAYHSPSMIPPVHWRGAEVVFYRVRPDASPDLSDIATKIDGKVKAIIATHFFGIPLDLAPLRALCDRHGIGLIEDCAHCFFGERDGVAVGSTGDYAIGSSMKFYPIYEGGCLVSRRHQLAPSLRSAGLGFEAKAALAALEAGFGYGRLPLLRAALALPLRAKSLLWSAVKARAATRATGDPAPAFAPASSDSGFDFDARWVDKRSSLFSRLVLRFASRARIVARRRQHYLALQRAFSSAPGCRPLYASLPDGACPWMFPLLVDRPEAVFEHLHANGVPMTRFGAHLWPGVDASVCANSAILGRRLIAFPCHQELKETERAWLIETVCTALQTTAKVAA